MRLQRKIFGKLRAHLCVIAVVMLMDAGLAFSQEPTTAVTPPVVRQDSGIRADAPQILPTDLYTVDQRPLTPVQCGQCHTGTYEDLRKAGGRHRFLCQNCHKSVHAYNPGRENWQELMPKCSDCHSTTIHNVKYTDCTPCHMNPHAIEVLTATETMLNACSECHSRPFEQFKSFPSAHSKQPCRNCHTTHGFIPSCNNCHKPHYQEQSPQTCTTCHPAHAPIVSALRKDADARTCNACHQDVYSKWIKSRSRHAKVSCATCHTKHGYIPACNDCHQAIHSQALLAKFRNCLICHQDVHDIPVKQRSR